jgi:hypothetical protein
MKTCPMIFRIPLPLFVLLLISFPKLIAQPDILAGVELKQITHFETNPSISAMKMSADGSTIVYATAGTVVKVFTLGTDGSGLTEVYDFQRTGSGPMIDISADGEKVIWCDGEGEIFIANRDGSGLDELASLIPNPDTNFADLEPIILLPPRITADGSQVFFINSDRDPRASGVWKVNSDNSSLAQVFNYLKLASDVFGRDGSEYSRNVAFADGFDISSDGSRMMFGTRIFKLEEGDLNRGHAIYAMGTELNNIGEYAMGNQPFAIDEDGEYCIMYRRELNPELEYDEINVYYMPLGTGDPVKVIGGLDIFGTSAFTQMAADGSRAITVAANGRLPVSFTDRVTAYAFDLVSVDALSIATGGFRLSVSYLPSINGNGDRFCFLSSSTPPQIWMGSIADDGAASLPKINGVLFEPDYVLKDASSPATISAHVTDSEHPIHLVTFESFKDGFLHYRALRSDHPNSGILVDDGTTGDESAGDNRYTNNTVNIDLPETPPGEYTVRIAAMNSTLEEITFVDAYSLSILEESTIVPGIKTPGFVLHPNYPNPFREQTTLGYEIPHQVHVSIKVYNVLGGRVATLLNEIQPAGRYQVVFDSRDLPSGIYYYSLKAGGFEQTAKLIFYK